MARLFLFILTALALVSVSRAEVVAPAVLDLTAVYQLALQRSETLQIKAEELEIAQARYRQAFATALPNITARAKPLWQDTTTANSRERSLTADITIKQPLFNGFREFSAISAAGSERTAQRLSLQRERELMYLDVAELFYQLIAWEKMQEVEQEAVRTLEKREADLQRRVDLGRSRRGELLQAQSELAQLRATLEDTRGGVLATRELIGFLIGMNADSFRLQSLDALPQVEQLATYLQNLPQRADVLSAEAQRDSQQKQIAIARSDLFPSVNLEGTHTPYGNPNPERDWNVFLTVSLPIFEGGLTQARVREQQARTRQAELDLERLRRSAERDTRIAYAQFIAVSEQFVQLSQLEQLASENARVQEQDYQRGIVSNLDVLDALRRWQNAQTSLAQARMLAQQKWVELAVTAGRTP